MTEWVFHWLLKRQSFWTRCDGGAAGYCLVSGMVCGCRPPVMVDAGTYTVTAPQTGKGRVFVRLWACVGQIGEIRDDRCTFADAKCCVDAELLFHSLKFLFFTFRWISLGMH